jgi:hypothetical protein
MDKVYRERRGSWAGGGGRLGGIGREGELVCWCDNEDVGTRVVMVALFTPQREWRGLISCLGNSREQLELVGGEGLSVDCSWTAGNIYVDVGVALVAEAQIRME